MDAFSVDMYAFSVDMCAEAHVSLICSKNRKAKHIAALYTCKPMKTLHSSWPHIASPLLRTLKHPVLLSFAHTQLYGLKLLTCTTIYCSIYTATWVLCLNSYSPSNVCICTSTEAHPVHLWKLCWVWDRSYCNDLSQVCFQGFQKEMKPF